MSICNTLLGITATLLLSTTVTSGQQTTGYSLDDTAGPSRTLDGIGGLSGGGATSVFLPYYPEPYRSQILDYLFLPNFGASLHILKCEIGGDAQSTDGAESSHMHNPWDEDYQRGYEWWLMTEAKKRNPNIKLYGLSWAFPQWVSCAPNTLDNCTNNPYAYPQQLATYITKWVSGAKNTYGLDIDYIGSWNERSYNTTYLKTLRATLDSNGFTNTKIVAPDSGWSIAQDILNDPELAAAIWGIGAHYPGMHSSSQAIQTGKQLWASEDDSTYNNAVGAECFARIINQNFVQGNMTATINWNLIAAYMKGTNWYRAGIMNAMQPWNGAYGAINADGSFTVGPMVWATAHTTQFTQPGWQYLATGGGPKTGSGMLQYGGSYVTIKNFTSGDFTIVIEKLTRNHSSCVRPGLPNYDTEDETATFTLIGEMASVKTLYLWYTHWAYDPSDTTVEFQQQTPVTVTNGQFTLSLKADSIYTLTTLNTGNKGSYGVPPVPVLFPVAHTDDFESCPTSSEAPYFADQNGIFECVPSNDPNHGQVMRQMVPLRPITWGGDIRPHSLVGHRDSKDQSLIVQAYIEEPGASVLLGVRMQGTDNSQGIIWAIDTNSSWGLWNSISNVGNTPIISGTSSVSIAPGQWHTYQVDINGTNLNVWIDGTQIVTNYNASALTASGHFAIGTKEYGQYTQFDNIQLYTKYTTCGTTPLVAGAPVSIVDCSAEVGPVPGSQWVFTPQTPGGWIGAFSLRSNSSLCIEAITNTTSNPWWLHLAVCDTNNPNQLWYWKFDGISPDNERASAIINPASGRCMDMANQATDIGLQMDAWACNGGTNQNFWYDHDQGEIGNEWSSTCVGVC